MLKAGQVFSRWTVMSNDPIKRNGKWNWLCRCDCGTERYVREQYLVSGSSQSCGCQTSKTKKEKTVASMIGREFGELKVIKRAEEQREWGGVWLTCQCSCGRECDCSAQLLKQGRRTNCGSRAGHGYSVSITGKKFNSLTALYPLDTRDKKGSIIWHCRCECGNEIDISRNALMFSNTKSCGCRKKKNGDNLRMAITFVDGTSMEAIKSHKLPTDNTTGYKGVYRSRGKYIARIVFQKKVYHLGMYKSLEEAAAVRKAAEEALYGKIIDYYDLYQRRASEDPTWAEKNPIHFNVKHDGTDFSVQITPVLPA